MTPLEGIAAAVIILSLVKLTALLINPDGWIDFAAWIYRGGWITQVVFLILAVGVLVGLLQTLSIVDVLACTAFAALVQGMGFAANPDITRELFDRYRKSRRRLRSAWPVALVWTLLCLWGLVALLS